MVTAGKVFKLIEPMPLSDLASKLQGHRNEEPYAEGEYKSTLVTEIVNLTPRPNSLNGVYSHDYVSHAFHRSKTVPLPRTIEALFNFSLHEDRVLLTVVEKKRLANFVTNRLSETIYDKTGHIAEARIPPETLRNFYLKNPEDTKVTFFNNVDTPNVDKLSLYGPDLVGTTLFEEYGKRRDLWYIVARSKEHGYVVGLTRDASVTIFNIVDKNKCLEYITKEIYPLIL